MSYPEIAALLPRMDAPMRLIDTLLAADATSARCAVTVGEGLALFLTPEGGCHPGG